MPVVRVRACRAVDAEISKSIAKAPPPHFQRRRTAGGWRRTLRGPSQDLPNDRCRAAVSLRKRPRREAHLLRRCRYTQAALHGIGKSDRVE